VDLEVVTAVCRSRRVVRTGWPLGNFATVFGLAGVNADGRRFRVAFCVGD
jgi:hypothetical protein